MTTHAAIATVAVALAIVVAIHEAGHYVVAARAGIPADERKIVWLALPAHVALRHDGDWVGPRQPERFRAAYGRYDPERRFAVPFNAAGFLAQAAVLVPIGFGIALLEPGGLTDRWDWIGRLLLSTSLGVVVGAVVWDLLATAFRGRSFGDFTHLWRFSPGYAIGTLALVVAIHVGALAVLTRV